MTKYLGILISPSGEEFYHAYGPMTKLRDRAGRFDDATVAVEAANQRYGRHSDAFWNSERSSRDRARVEYRGWTSRTEAVADDDVRRRGHYVTDYPKGETGGERLYATRDDKDTIGWSVSLGNCTLWPTRNEALAFIQTLPRHDDRAYCIETY